MRNEECIVCEICATWADGKELKCKTGNPLTAMVADPNVPWSPRKAARHPPLSGRTE